MGRVRLCGGRREPEEPDLEADAERAEPEADDDGGRRRRRGRRFGSGAGVARGCADMVRRRAEPEVVGWGGAGRGGGGGTGWGGDEGDDMRLVTKWENIRRRMTSSSMRDIFGRGGGPEGMVRCGWGTGGGRVGRRWERRKVWMWAGGG